MVPAQARILFFCQQLCTWMYEQSVHVTVIGLFGPLPDLLRISLWGVCMLA